MYTPTASQSVVKTSTTLLPYLMAVMPGVSRTRAKAILSGGGVKVDGRIQRQFDLPLTPGQTVEIARHKPRATLNSPFVKIVFEDAHIIVVEKNIGILSMATNHHAFSVKSVLDEYFRRSKQGCTAHVVHRLDRDTSGLLVYAKSIRAEQILEHNWHEIVTDRRKRYRQVKNHRFRIFYRFSCFAILSQNLPSALVSLFAVSPPVGRPFKHEQPHAGRDFSVDAKENKSLNV